MSFILIVEKKFFGGSFAFYLHDIPLHLGVRSREVLNVTICLLKIKKKLQEKVKKIIYPFPEPYSVSVLIGWALQVKAKKIAVMSLVSWKAFAQEE